MTGKNQPDFKALLSFAHELADTSAAAIRPHFRKSISVTNKASPGDFDPVTAADTAAERAIRKAIDSHWPEHGVIGEEYAHTREGARYRWVIDPIDGTRAFIMGSPLWGTLIGLLDGDEPVLGLMDQPFTGERFWTGPRESYRREADGKARRLKTREGVGLAEAILTTTHPDLLAKGKEQKAFARLKSQARMSRYGGDCYSYCLLAAGFVDLVVETGLKPHDIVALIPIIERAGGRVTTWTGEPATAGGRIIAAGNAELHAEAMAVLAG
jgi:myo-inositol-1(or 4)-monophosphatase